MTDPLAAQAQQLRRVAAALGAAGATLAGADPGPSAFGADGIGRLGDLGAQLRRQWQECLQARTQEAVAHATRLDLLADGLGQAAAGYADTDHSASRRAPAGS